MKWFIIVLMLGAYADGRQDMFWFNKPAFETVEECQIYVTLNSNNIRMEMAEHYGPKPIEMVYCVREDHLSQFGVPDQV